MAGPDSPSSDSLLLLVFLAGLVKCLRLLLCTWTLPLFAVTRAVQPWLASPRGACPGPGQVRFNIFFGMWLRVLASTLVFAILALLTVAPVFWLLPQVMNTTLHIALASTATLVLLVICAYGLYATSRIRVWTPLRACLCSGRETALPLPLADLARGVAVALLDLVVFCMAVLVLVGGIRARYVWGIDSRVIVEDARKKHRWYVAKQLAMTLVDWILVPIVLLLAVSWRHAYLVEAWKKRWGKEDQEGNLRLKVLELLVKFIFDVPFVLLLVLQCVLPWRLVTSVTHMWRLRNHRDISAARSAIRFTIAKETLIMLLDVPACLCFVLLHVTHRCMHLHRELKAHSAGFLAMGPTVTQVMEVQAENEQRQVDLEELPGEHDVAEWELAGSHKLDPEADVPPDTRSTWHVVVFTQFFFAIIDLPFLLLFAVLVLTVSRTKYVLAVVRHDGATAMSRRLFVLGQFVLLILDIPTIAVLFALTVTWRCVSVWRRVLAIPPSGHFPPNPTDRHAIVWKELLKLLADIPFIALALCSFIFFWRLPLIVRDVLRARDSHRRYRHVVQQLGLGIMDVVCVALSPLLCCGFHRLGSLRRRLKDPLTIGLCAGWPPSGIAVSDGPPDLDMSKVPKQTGRDTDDAPSAPSAPPVDDTDAAPSAPPPLFGAASTEDRATKASIPMTLDSSDDSEGDMEPRRAAPLRVSSSTNRSMPHLAVIPADDTSSPSAPSLDGVDATDDAPSAPPGHLWPGTNGTVAKVSPTNGATTTDADDDDSGEDPDKAVSKPDAPPLPEHLTQAPYCCCACSGNAFKTSNGERANRFESHWLILRTELQTLMDLPFVLLAVVLLVMGLPTQRSKYFLVDFQVLIKRMKRQRVRDVADGLIDPAALVRSSHLRMCALHHFIAGVLDWPILVMRALLFLSVYRNPSDLNMHPGRPALRKTWDLYSPSVFVFKEFLWLLFDLPFIGLLLAAMLFFSWRIPAIVWDMRRSVFFHSNVPHPGDVRHVVTSHWPWRRAVLRQLLYGVLDVICLPFALVTLCSLLRTRQFAAKAADLWPNYSPYVAWKITCCCGSKPTYVPIEQREGDEEERVRRQRTRFRQTDETEKRPTKKAPDGRIVPLDTKLYGAIMGEFVQLLITLPFVPFVIIAFLVPWRRGLVTVEASTASYKQAWRQERAWMMKAVKHSLLLLLDLPALAMFGFVHLTRWRSQHLTESLRDRVFGRGDFAQEAQERARIRSLNSCCQCESLRLAWFTWQHFFGHTWLFHWYVLLHFVMSVLELPFALCYIIVRCSWRRGRAVVLYEQTAADKQWSRRGKILGYTALLVLDPIALVLGFLVLLSWRGNRMLLKLRGRDNPPASGVPQRRPSQTEDAVDPRSSASAMEMGKLTRGEDLEGAHSDDEAKASEADTSDGEAAAEARPQSHKLVPSASGNHLVLKWVSSAASSRDSSHSILDEPDFRSPVPSRRGTRVTVDEGNDEDDEAKQDEVVSEEDEDEAQDATPKPMATLSPPATPAQPRVSSGESTPVSAVALVPDTQKYSVNPSPSEVDLNRLDMELHKEHQQIENSLQEYLGPHDEHREEVAAQIDLHHSPVKALRRMSEKDEANAQPVQPTCLKAKPTHVAFPHAVVFTEFTGAVLDLPFLVLVVASVCTGATRTHVMLRVVFEMQHFPGLTPRVHLSPVDTRDSKATDWAKRLLILLHFFLGIADVLCLIVCVPLLFTWRSRKVSRLLGKHFAMLWPCCCRCWCLCEEAEAGEGEDLIEDQKPVWFRLFSLTEMCGGGDGYRPFALEILKQIAFFLVDLPMLLAALLLLVFPWRAFPLYKRLSHPDTEFGSIAGWRLIAGAWLAAIIDLPFVAIFLALVVSPVVLALYSDHISVRIAEDWFDDRSVDVWVLVFCYATVVFCAVHVLAMMRDILFRSKGRDSAYRRRVVLQYLFIFVFCNVPTTALGVVILGTLYRIPSVYRSWKKRSGGGLGGDVDVDMEAGHEEEEEEEEEEHQAAREVTMGERLALHRAVLVHTLLVIVDLPFFALALLLGPFLHRSLPLWRACLTNETSSAGARRRLTCMTLVVVVVDVLTILPLALVVGTLYRIGRLRSDWKSVECAPCVAWFRNDVPVHHHLQAHGHAWRHALHVLVDIPFLAMFVVVFCTLWRLPRLVEQVYAAAQGGLSVRKVVWSHFVSWFKDLPFVLLFVLLLLSLIRAVPLLRDVIWRAKTSPQRRWAVLHQFAMLFLDVLQLVGFVVVLIAPYRLAAIVRELDVLDTHQYSGYVPGAGGDRYGSYWIVFRHALGAIIDTPLNVIFLVLCCTVYRGYAVVRDVRADRDLRIAKGGHRMIVLRHLWRFILDVPFILLAVVLLFVGCWRFVWVVWLFLQQGGNPDWSLGQRRLLILQAIVLAFTDVSALILTVVVVACLWRLPTFIAGRRRRRPWIRNSLRTVYLMLKDVLSLVEIVVTLVLIHRARPVLRRIASVTKRYRRRSLASNELVERAYFREAAAEWSGLSLEVLRREERRLGLGPAVDEEAVGAPHEHVLVVEGDRAEYDRLKDEFQSLRDIRSEDGFGFYDKTTTEDRFPSWWMFSTESVLAAEDGDVAEGAGVREPGQLHNADYPFSLSLWRSIVHEEFKLTFTTFDVVFFFPVRVAAYLFVPVFAYVKWRLGGVDAPVQPRPPRAAAVVDDEDIQQPEPELDPGEVLRSQLSSRLTKSYLWVWVLWLYRRCPTPSTRVQDFTRMERFFLIGVLWVPLLIVADLLTLPILVLLIAVVTLATPGVRNSPWEGDAEAKDNVKLSKCQQVQLFMSLLWQFATLPVVLVLLGAVVMLPVIVWAVAARAVHVSESYEVRVEQEPWWIWLVLAVWVLFAVTSIFQLLRRFNKQRNRLYRPWGTLVVLGVVVINSIRGQSLLWRAYRWLLVAAVRVLYKVRGTCGFIGRVLAEIFMLATLALWAGWPVAVALLLIGDALWLIVAAPLTIVFTFAAYTIIKHHWRPADLVEVQPPKRKPIDTMRAVYNWRGAWRAATVQPGDADQPDDGMNDIELQRVPGMADEDLDEDRLRWD